MARNSLKAYRKKRDFAKTAEPEGVFVRGTSTRFVLHEHHASRLHFDLRLEMGGVLKSFAVPKGPSLDPKEKRLAVNTEDHPIQYLEFQGSIADGQYGAGEMRIWDTGVYALAEGGDPLPAYDRGRLRLVFRGEKLRGSFMLLRTARGDGRQWLLFKLKDEEAVADWTPARILPYGSRKEKPAAPESPALSRMPDFSNLDKVYWPGEGYTKGDLIRYYDKVSSFILPHLKGRPLILKRYPNGIGRPPFFQHEIKNPPAWLATAEDREESRGRMIRYAICDNRESLLYLANLGVIPLHPFLSRVPRLERPDWTVFDLDPGDIPFD
ncbi:MAG TPA: DNA polymerase ligase N-terminal domain-containing protein, partial [Fibrobacteria bacterium]|nr:DNA polymerase ligase N-terminal domain-containing protein [Fibrobacteria bacterium]